MPQPIMLPLEQVVQEVPQYEGVEQIQSKIMNIKSFKEVFTQEEEDLEETVVTKEVIKEEGEEEEREDNEKEE